MGQECLKMLHLKDFDLQIMKQNRFFWSDDDIFVNLKIVIQTGKVTNGIFLKKL